MSEEKIKWLVSKRNKLFLTMCFMVHLFFLGLFLFLGIHGMAILNAMSACFYMYFIWIRKECSETTIVYSYFEIILFSLISTVVIGRETGFALYVIGMISVVFYLAHHHGAKRFLYQGIGVGIVLAIVLLEPFYQNYFEEYKRMIQPYYSELYAINLCITLMTVVIVSFLYAQELNWMNKEISKINKKLDYRARHDALTGLSNRHEMNQYIDRLSNEGNHSLAVAMLDVDDFKKLNDRYGHVTGDYVLRKIAELMNTYLGDFQTARWGGEEFLVIGSKKQKEVVLEKIRQFHNAVQQAEFVYEEQKLDVHMTIGLAFGEDTKKVNHLIVEADELLYVGKNKNKNCIVTENRIIDNESLYKK